MIMSPDNKPAAAAKSAGKEGTHSSAGRKTASARPHEPVLKCPRCDSPNTKFCYYNNYSLTQPRHFCKTCRRYWTKGGALRNVPIGGGCRKSKKMKPSPRLSGGDSKDHSSGSSSDLGGLKFFQGISPTMDFQLNFPRTINHQSTPNTGLFINQFSPFGNISNTCGAISSSPFDPSAGSSSPLMGFTFPFSNCALKANNTNFQEMGGGDAGALNVPNSVATSIESLSCMNQDLHWKLQQQRLAMLFVEDNNNNQKEASVEEPIIEKPLQPILFENLDIIPKPAQDHQDQSCVLIGRSKEGGNLSTEWYFDNSYATVNNSTPATSSSNVNWSGASGINQAWSDHLSHFNSIP